MDTILERTWIGIDISKHHWDVAFPETSGVLRLAANSAGAQRSLQLLQQRSTPHVCLEATGGYESVLVATLRDQGIAVSVINPRQIRDFAKAHGQLAKTDHLDAKMILRYAMLMQPEPTRKPSENEEKLRALRARRQQVSDALVQEKNRLDTQYDQDARHSIEEAIDFYQRQLNSLDTQIQHLMQAVPEFRQRLSLLVSVPGVGETTAAALMADLPELGKLNRRQAARLAGLAPINRDSGTLRGKRMTGGGRADIRKGLFMATLVATKHNPIIREFYRQLIARGKAKMTALTACMRKLLLILNAIIKYNTPWKCTQNA